MRASDQRQLLGLILERAAGRSASFAEALREVERAGAPDPGELTRELLTDLTIRDWIALVREDERGAFEPLPRTSYWVELAAARNWAEDGPGGRARYVLTEKGRERLSRRLATR